MSNFEDFTSSFEKSGLQNTANLKKFGKLPAYENKMTISKHFQTLSDPFDGPKYTHYEKTQEIPPQKPVLAPFREQAHEIKLQDFAKPEKHALNMIKEMKKQKVKIITRAFRQYQYRKNLATRIQLKRIYSEI